MSMDPNRFEEWRACFLVALGREYRGLSTEFVARESAEMADDAMVQLDKRRPTDPCPPMVAKQDVVTQLPADEMSAGSLGWP